MYGADSVKKFLFCASSVMKENNAMLCQLDAAMGDGDIGTNMEKGFALASKYASEMDAPPGDLLKEAGRCFMEEAASTLGTLMGLFLRAMGRTLGNAEMFTFSDLLVMLQNGYDEIVKRGKAKLGEKTILDTLYPAITAMKMTAEKNESPRQCLMQGVIGARDGLTQSTQMKAVHGRPAYFGDKTIGLQDAGATVGVLLMECIAQAFGENS